MNNTTSQPGPACIVNGMITDVTVDQFLNAADVIMLLSSIVSSFLQVYVIRSALSHLRRRASDECLHLFLLSMTAGDLILTAFCYPLEIIQHFIGYAPTWVNMMMHFLTWASLSTSSISLILLNLDKLLYFKYPLSYSAVVSKSKGIGIVVATWVACFSFVLAAWLTGSFNCGPDNCLTLKLFHGNTGMYIGFTIGVCILPTLTSLGVALYILKIVSMHKKQLSEEQTLCGNNNGGPHTHQTFASRLRTFYFIFMTTIFTACTLLPYRVINMKRLISPATGQSQCVTLLFLWIMWYLVQLNAVVNPVLTVTVLPQYRARICRKLFGLSDGSEAHTKAVTATHL
ncbi:unnamed protein product, partial [Mesorhabditis spiculigera]